MTAQLLHRLVGRAADRAAGALAVLDGETSLTYGELDRRAEVRAACLRAQGVERGDRVALRLPKSASAVAWVHGILRAGACVVPIDPHAPAERVRRIAVDCRACALVLGSAPADGSDPTPGLFSAIPSLRAVVVDRPDPTGRGPDRVTIRRPHGAGEEVVLAGEPSAGSPVRLIDDDLAYILYTSGSTGSPKGVMLSHRNVAAFVEWAVAEVGLQADDRLVNHAPFHFDLSTFDLFGAALAGGSTVLVPRSATLFPRSLAQLVTSSGATVLYLVPSALVGLLTGAGLGPGQLAQLRVVMFAGEVLAPRHLAALASVAPAARCYNLYGPTETNVCTFHRVRPDVDRSLAALPIGTACPYVEVLVVGDDGRPVAAGEAGEVCVRGASVMAGYWGDPARTAGAFDDLPLLDRHSGPAYRTGDVARVDRDGRLWFVGRRDFQVKRRGVRIELAEVEAALCRHPAVAECAVVATTEGEDVCLTAVVAVTEPVTEGELRETCGRTLPRSMFPDACRVLEALPKTSSGKVDRQRLRRDVAETIVR